MLGPEPPDRHHGWQSARRMIALPALALAFALALPGASASATAATSASAGARVGGDAGERAAAIEVATRFLDQLDGGQYGSTWELTGAHMRRLTARPMWAATLSAMRGGTGALKSRKLEGASFARTLPGSPPGHYFVIRFDSRFERLAAEEKIVLNLERGQWRIEGFAMNPRGGKAR